MRYAILLVIIMTTVVGGVGADDAVRKISLKLDEADIGDALAQISQKAQISILGDATVKGTVTCSLNDVTVEQALDLISKMNKLEWLKVFTSAPSGEKLTASPLFNLIDALKQLGGMPVIWQLPAERTQMVYVPALDAKSFDTSVFIGQLALKEVYLLRAKPDPVADKAKKEKEQADKQAGSVASGIPPSDPQTAAAQVWGYFHNMSPEQRVEVMGELRRIFDRMSPDEKEAFGRSFFGGYTGGEPKHAPPPMVP